MGEWDIPAGPQAGPGHNSVFLSPESAAEMMRDITTPVTERRNQFVKAAENAVIRDRESAGDAADVLRLGGKAFDRLDDQKKDLSEPLRLAGAAMTRELEQFWQPVWTAHRALRQRLSDWWDAENQRVKDQEDEQRAAMARLAPQTAAPAPAPVQATPAKAEPVRGLLGGRVANVAKRTYEIEDMSKVPAWIMETETVKAAILKVCESTGKHHATIPGIRIQDGQKARIT